jgi:hypothetical protein
MTEGEVFAAGPAVLQLRAEPATTRVKTALRSAGGSLNMLPIPGAGNSKP